MDNWTEQRELLLGIAFFVISTILMLVIAICGYIAGHLFHEIREMCDALRDDDDQPS